MPATLPVTPAFTQHIDSNTVLAIRRDLFGSGRPLTQADVDDLVRRNDAAVSACEEWNTLFIEALTDFVVRQQSPQGYVDDAKADWLLSAIRNHRLIKVDSELELLIHVVETAEDCPARLFAETLRLCAAHALHAASGRGVTEGDVRLLRRVIYAGASEGGISVSRAEAEVLFDINDAVRGRDNCPGWRDLFVHAIASSILTVSTYHSPAAAMVLRQERWLSQPSHIDFVGAFCRGVLPTLQQALAPDIAAERREHLAADDAAQIAAHQVDADEWRWLTERVGRDGVNDPNEQALIAFVRADAATPPTLSVAHADVETKGAPRSDLMS